MSAVPYPLAGCGFVGARAVSLYGGHITGFYFFLQFPYGVRAMTVLHLGIIAFFFTDARDR